MVAWSDGIVRFIVTIPSDHITEVGPRANVLYDSAHNVGSVDTISAFLGAFVWSPLLSAETFFGSDWMVIAVTL